MNNLTDEPVPIRSLGLRGSGNKHLPEHAIGGEHLIRFLNEVCARHGKPVIMQTDNGKAMLIWAHSNCVALRLIDRDNPN